MKNTDLTPKTMTALWVEQLRARSDPDRAAGSQRYFKDTIVCFGLTAPQMRELAGDAYAMIKGSWAVGEAVEFCGLMLANPVFEVKAIGILVLERFRKDYPKSLFRTIRGWLLADYCDNWASVDSLCPTSVGALLERYPDLVPSIRTWTRSPNRWVRRAALVSFIKLAKKPGFRDGIYEISRSLFPDADDLVQKANGWLLREAGKADPARLERFLRTHGPAVPRTTLRYAIERFDDQKRRSILVTTRGC
jgi:3-methyladenine DNA glycosylase AlkD